MNILKRFAGRNINVLQFAKFASVSAIDKVLKSIESEGKDYCVNIGNDVDKDKYQTISMEKPCDFFGDFRCCFAPGYKEHIGEYPDLSDIPYGHYRLVRCVNQTASVEWIHLETMFQWMRKLLSPGGVLYIVTPNADYIVREYIKAMNRFYESREVKSDIFGQHPYLAKKRPPDIARGLNFKLFSGCSLSEYEGGLKRGDNKFSVMDAVWLEYMLIVDEYANGFVDVYIDYSSDYLYAIARKPEVGDSV